MKIVPAFGPTNAKIALVGEAPGEQEEKLGVPFIGFSGKELESMLFEVGLKKYDCFITYVIKTRPPNDDITKLFVPKKNLPSNYSEPPIAHNKYLDPSYLHFVKEVRKEVLQVKPNLIIALGNTALWAFTGSYGIAKTRGVIHDTPYGKVLPIYHPSAVLRQYALRPITVADLLKAKIQSQFPEVRRPERFLVIQPTIEEAFEFERKYLVPAASVSFDIETKGKQITCISLAPSHTHSICIPFFDPTKIDANYWRFEEELEMWKLVKRHLEKRDRVRIAQNGLYDIQYLIKYNIKPPFLEEDTMLKHHAIYPEMKKSLGFLASVHTDELSWKDMAKELGRDK